MVKGSKVVAGKLLPSLAPSADRRARHTGSLLRLREFLKVTGRRIELQRVRPSVGGVMRVEVEPGLGSLWRHGAPWGSWRADSQREYRPVIKRAMHARGLEVVCAAAGKRELREAAAAKVLGPKEWEEGTESLPAR